MAALQEDQQKLEKDKNRLVHAPLSFAQMQALEKDIAEREKSVLNRENTLQAQGKNLDERELSLRKQCDDPKNVPKIREIALGVIRKNQPKKKAYDAAVKQMNAIKGKMDRAEVQMNACKEQMAIDRGENEYKLASNGGSGGSAPSGGHGTDLDVPAIIADAITGYDEATMIVLRSYDEQDSRMKKDWKMMSVFDREEERMKALRRDI